MNQTFRVSLICVCLCGLIGVFLSCSQTELDKYTQPTFYSEIALSQANDLVNEGYALLDSNDVDGAVARFTEAGTHVPNGMEREYHTACAYARTGNAEEAFKWLQQLVDNGFDQTMGLEYEQDFNSIREDSRFEQIIERAKLNNEKNCAVFANGLPEPEEPAEKFISEEDLKTWADQQQRLIRKHQRYWTEGQYLTARINYTASRLAAMKTLKEGDPEYDSGLERVRAAARLKSIFDPGWGSISDLINKEVAAYVETASIPAGINEANYHAGTAWALKFSDDPARKADSYNQADVFLAKVGEDSEFYGAAQAMKVINKLEIAGTGKEELRSELKNILIAHPGDEMIYRVMSTRLNHEGAGIVWPINLEVSDVDGKQVALSEYKGKVLLIDFWATWCSPCRAELPELIKVYNEFHPQGFEIVSISLDYANRMTLEALLDWTKENGLTWRHVYSGKGWDTELVKKFFVGSIPAPFMVGPDGELFAWGEDCRGDKLETTVKKALGLDRQ